MRRSVLGLAAVVALLAVTSPVLAAEKKKKKKKEKEKDKESGEPAKPEVAKLEEKAEPAPKPVKRFLPDWEQKSFDWQFSPIFAYRMQTAEANGLTTTSATSEAGLRLGVSDIGIVPGNPGVSAGAHAGMAFGTDAAVVTGPNNLKDKKNTTYKRTFGGIGVTNYLRFVRQTIGIEKAKLEYNDEGKTLTQTMGFDHDLAVLLLSTLSEHYTFTYLRAYGAEYDKWFLIERDNWLHTRYEPGILSIVVDFGPGLTFVEEQQAKGTTDYIKLLTQMHIFWKLGWSGSAKYVLASSEERIGESAGVRLPNEDLDKPSSVAMPEDSFLGSFFFGVSNIAYGVGVGYHYNLQILNLGKHKGRERITTKDSGFGASFTAAL